MRSVSSLKRKSLHDEVVELVRAMILSGELEPGKKIHEQQLCFQFDISRTPLREALKVLAAEGVVELLPQRGARVAVIKEEELNELFPIIASLEALAGELACANVRREDIERIRGMHESMIHAYGREEHIAYSQFNRGIHMAIFELADNSALTALYTSLEHRIRSIRHTARQTPEDWRTAVEDHEKIVVALEARDSEALARILKIHVKNTADMVRRALLDQISA